MNTLSPGKNGYFYFLVILVGIGCTLWAPAVYTADTQSLYDEARNNFQEKNYADARDQFNRLLEMNASGDLERKAHYLLGRILYNREKEPARALEHFYEVYSDSTRDNLTDDAIYLIGDILITQLNQPEMGIPYLKTLKDHFPNSDYHSDAVSRLEKLSDDKKARTTTFDPADVPQPKIKLDYEKVDVKQFIASYAKLSGKNVIYNPDISGEVSIIGRRGIPINNLFSVVLNVLESKGYTMIKEESGAYRVKSTQRALKDGVTMEDRQSGYRTQLFSLGNLSWNEVQQPIKSMLPQQKNLFHLEGINYVGITAPPSHLSEIRNLLTGLKSIKGPGSRKVIHTYSPEYAQASRLVSKLNSFLPTFLDQDEFKIVSMQRSNTVLVALPEEQLDFLKQTLQQFDKDLVDRLRIKTFRLEHASAKQVAAQLKQLLNVLPANTQQRDIQIIPDDRQNAVIVSAVSSKALSIIERSIKDLDGEDAPSPAQTHVYKVKNTKAGPLAEKLNFLFEQDDKNIRVTADEQTNSLIFSAPPSRYDSIKKFITKLDKPKKQILVDAFIAEASNDKVKRLGIEWTAAGSVDGRPTTTGTNFGQRAEFQTGSLFGFNTGIFNKSGSDLLGIMTAFASDEDFQILSTSHLVANENEEASLSVGEIVPILQDSQVTEEGSLNRSFSFENVGIDLNITPTISGDTQITLDVIQKIQQLQQQEATELGAPQRRNRTLETRVSIPNNRTLVLGGVLSSESNETEQSVPYLDDIPGLGMLFKNRNNSRNRRNLLIFLTPHILDSNQDIEDATERLRQDQTENIKKEQSQRIKENLDTTPLNPEHKTAPDTAISSDTPSQLRN